MKKYALLAISIVALMAGCKGNKTEKGDVTTTDSLAQDSLIEVIDTTPPPALRTTTNTRSLMMPHEIAGSYKTAFEGTPTLTKRYTTATSQQP